MSSESRSQRQDSSAGVLPAGFFPQYEMGAVAAVPELRPVLVETPAATATSQMAKAVRKQCMANRLVAYLFLESPGFTFEPCEAQEPVARLLRGLVRRTSEPSRPSQLLSESGSSPRKESQARLRNMHGHAPVRRALVTPPVGSSVCGRGSYLILFESSTSRLLGASLLTFQEESSGVARPPRPTVVGEGRRAWRRSLPAEMPKSAAELTKALSAMHFDGSFVDAPQESPELCVLFLRAQGSRSKEAAIMALEFEVAASHAGVTYRELAPGLVVIAQTGSTEPFLREVNRLSALRRPPVRLCKPLGLTSTSELAAAVAELPALQTCSTWWLDVLLREAQVDASLLPLKHCQGGDLALEVVAALASR